ncbi:MAG: hypothetical protein K940chlam3_00746 [Chlamydiae bacterium]|nr:hypothetical protein [Chlamydiota bacterium]
MNKYKKFENGIILNVKIIPKSQNDLIVGWEENILKIRLNAVPEKGKANRALINLLSKRLKISKTRISLISGETSRQKRVYFHNISFKELDSRLQDWV